MSVFEKHDFIDAEEFIQFLRLSGDTWRTKNEYRSGWMFRGQNDEAYRLIPNAFRRPAGSYLESWRNQAAKRYAGRNWQDWAQLPATYAPAEVKETALDALAHADMVRRFALFADYVSHPVTIEPYLWHLPSEDVKEWSLPEKKDSLSAIAQLAKTKDSCSALALIVNGGLENLNVQMFAVAQHHRIPTQFLDWTYNPLVAAYFAADPKATSTRIAVWALREQLFDFQWDIKRMTVKAGVTPFLDAQEGLFIWCPDAYLMRLENGAYLNFDDMIRNMDTDARCLSVPRPFLIKATLPRSQVVPLLKLLWRERVTPAHLMPTFDNIRTALEIETEYFLAP